jgi:UPF0755 protein
VSDLFGLSDEPPAPRPDRGTYRRRRVLVGGVAVVIVVVLVAIVVGAAHVIRGFGGGSNDYTGQGSGKVLVVVKDGDSLATIGNTLTSDGVTRTVGAFTSAAAANSKATTIGPGTYRLHKHMKASLALSLMLTPSARVDYRVTIPEGFTVSDIVARVAADTPISASSMNNALGSPSSIGLPSYAGGHVEGFLFPATYDVQPGTTATQLLSQMVARFQQSATSDKLASGAKKLGLSEYDVVTLASMVQREGRLTADFPKIAEVFTNRLHQGMRLDSDATLFYVLGPNHGPLTASDLANPTPYNTRLHTGLPPTPINSPGDAAIDAVLHHPSGPLLYFVTIDKAGHTAFATTLSKFNELVAQSKANGVS